jgi:hypothetical protein
MMKSSFVIAEEGLESAYNFSHNFNPFTIRSGISMMT